MTVFTGYRHALCATILLCLTALPSTALDSFTVHSGLLLVIIAEEDGPPNLLVPPIGAWIPVGLPAPGAWSWEAGVMLVGMTYRYEDGRGVPVEVEAGNSFWVAGLVPDLRIGRLFPLAAGVDLFGSAGLSLFLRVPVIPYDEASSDLGALAGYLLIRSLYPELAASLRWEIVEDLRLVFDVRLLYPVYNFFDNEAPSLADHLTAGILVGLQFPLR